jgi:hypothetical protein
MEVYFRVLWDSIDKGVAGNKLIDEMLDSKPEDRRQCVLDVPAYSCHPVVLDCRAKGDRLPMPLAIYLDGVCFVSQSAGRSETVTELWIHNLLTGVRHFVAGVNSGDQCACGCRGHCTMYPVMLHIHWMIKAREWTNR